MQRILDSYHTSPKRYFNKFNYLKLLQHLSKEFHVLLCGRLQSWRFRSKHMLMQTHIHTRTRTHTHRDAPLVALVKIYSTRISMFLLLRQSPSPSYGVDTRLPSQHHSTRTELKRDPSFSLRPVLEADLCFFVLVLLQQHTFRLRFPERGSRLFTTFHCLLLSVQIYLEHCFYHYYLKYSIIKKCSLHSFLWFRSK